MNVLVGNKNKSTRKWIFTVHKRQAIIMAGCYTIRLSRMTAPCSWVVC